MRIALITDIHANREGFEACLAAIERHHVDRIVILGDIVGYGADPVWCVEKVRALQENGAIVIRGNHDEAAARETDAMGSSAHIAMSWTRGVLEPKDRAFLGNLPLSVEDEDRLYIHASAAAPSRWTYIVDNQDAGAHFAASRSRLSFCGHVHQPTLYGLSEQGKISRFSPNNDCELPLLAQRRWLAVIGSAGQPRDGDPQAGYGLYNTVTRELRFMHVPYDIDSAAGKIRAAGLPEALASRLFRGN
jgi:diadenosine tetraphosphatase ApaH/serine/threonine PP2A family protein phosphatase